MFSEAAWSLNSRAWQHVVRGCGSRFGAATARFTCTRLPIARERTTGLGAALTCGRASSMPHLILSSRFSDARIQCPALGRLLGGRDRAPLYCRRPAPSKHKRTSSTLLKRFIGARRRTLRL